jgi:membrane protein implicated in regulation of membrane protease activity
MDVWIIVWVVIALLAVVGEVMTTGLFLASLAVAAVVAAVAAIFLPVILQAAIFGGVGLAAIAVLRPFVLHALGMESHDLLAGQVTHSHLLGRRAVVTNTVEPGAGLIRVGEGEFWTARPYNETDVIPAGTPVEILLVDGLTALVAPVEPIVPPHPSIAGPTLEARDASPTGPAPQSGASGAEGKAS